MRRLAILLPLAAIVAACGGQGRQATTAPTTAATTTAAAPTRTQPPAPRPAERGAAGLRVTVVDGDLGAPVAGARVRIAGRSRRADRAGVVRFPAARSRTPAVTVSAPGFATRTVRAARTGGTLTVRIYRPELQWPMYGVDAARTQAQTHIRLRPPFRTVWSVALGGLLEFPAIVDEGVAYIGNAHATVYAISMRDGRILWRHTTPDGKMASSPAVDGEELVYHSMDGHVFVLDRATGRLRWSYDVGSPIESSPIAHDGVDFFGAWNGTLYALDLRTHRLLWSRELGAKITSSAAIAGGTLYIGDYAGHVWALVPGTGATRWVQSVNGRVYGTPAVAGGRVFVPSSSGDSMTAFTTAGTMLWRVQTGGYVYSSPAVWGGRVFFGSYSGVFYSVSAANGEILWEVGTGGPVSGAAVVVDGIAYAGSFSHTIVGVGARSGHVVLRFPHGEYVPVSGNGMRLLFHGYSRLYAVEPRLVRKANTHAP